jgi:phage tail sheath protein FI
MCERRRAFLIVDPPFKWRRASDVGLAQLGTTSRNAAVYFPHLIEHISSGAQRTVAPGGAIAGVFARIDTTRGVWKAPAGAEATIAGTLGVTLALSDADHERLNALGVNALRASPGQAPVVWGARTLANDAEWKYVPVRRLALFLEVSIERGLTWVVFEPNAAPRWSKVRLSVENFLMTAWRAGALQGAKPEHAFFVRCDAQTLGELEIGYAPLKPAEFVILRFRWTEAET